MSQITIECTKDAYVYNGTSWLKDENFNENRLIVGRVGGYYRSFLHFPLAELAGKDITNARLKIVVDLCDDNTLNFSAHCVSQDWSETSVTWNNQPPYTENGAVNLVQENVTQGYCVFYNITNLIKDIIDNDRDYYGILLRQPGSTDNTIVQYYSRERTYKPQLIVDYKAPIKFNGVEVANVTYNGQAVQKIKFNGVEL